MSRALIIVDVQYDFLPATTKIVDIEGVAVEVGDRKAGALPVPNGHEVIQPLVLLSYEVDLTIATRDWHPQTHTSFKEINPEGLWPTHCVAGSVGAQLDPGVDMVADIIISKGTNSDKEAYSGFDATFESYPHLAKILQWHTSTLPCLDYDEIIIGGLATDYCVAATAFDAKKFFGDVRVVVLSDASRGIWNEKTEQELAQEFDDAGIEYLTRAEL